MYVHLLHSTRSTKITYTLTSISPDLQQLLLPTCYPLLYYYYFLLFIFIHSVDTMKVNNNNQHTTMTSPQRIKKKYIRHTFPPLFTGGGGVGNNNARNNSIMNDNNEHDNLQTIMNDSDTNINKWLHEQLAQTLDNLVLIETKLNDGNDDDHDKDSSHCHDNGHFSTRHSTITVGDCHSNGTDTKEGHEQQQQQIVNTQDPRHLFISLEHLSLAHGYLTINDHDDDHDHNTCTATYNHQNMSSLLSSWSNLIQTHTKLAKLLLHHLSPTHSKITNIYTICTNTNDDSHQPLVSSSYQKLYHKIHDHYTKIYQHLYAKSILEIRNYIRMSNFPSRQQKQQQQQLPTTVNVQFAITTLIQIQLWNHLLIQHNSNGNNSTQTTEGISTTTTSLSSFTIQSIKTTITNLIIKEFMKPIVYRVKYHFLITNNKKNSDNNDDNNNDKHVSLMEEMTKRPDKIVSWICSYIQDLIQESDMITVWDWIQSITITNNKDLVEQGVVTTKVMKGGMNIDNAIEYDCTEELQHSITNSFSPCYIHECFMNDINQLIQFVLLQHDFFRSLKRSRSTLPTIHTSSSSSAMGIQHDHEKEFLKHKHGYNGNQTMMAMNHVIESMLRYDAFTMDILSHYYPQNQHYHLSSSSSQIMTLIDYVVLNENEIWQWWLECERINALQELNIHHKNGKNDYGNNRNYNNDESLLFILPYCETFLSLLKAFEMKSSLISQSQSRKMFTKKVEVPVCVCFMETMHEKASILRKELIGRGASSSISRGVININSFKTNIERWIDVITGTTLAAITLHSTRGHSNNNARLQQPTCQNDGDEKLERSRIGNSLSKLADAMVEELSATIVEELLLERTKFASYLMQCPHTLSSDEIEVYHSFFFNEISPELRDVYQLLQVLCDVCMKRAKYTHDRQVILLSDDLFVLYQIPNKIVSNVATRVEEKFIEVALDYNMIPALCGGCRIFAFDTNFLSSLFCHLGDDADSPFKRLKEVTHLMTMDVVKFEALRDAMKALLCNPLDEVTRDEVFDASIIEQLESDGTLFNEVESMIQAQGFHTLTIYDAINIMNRRVNNNSVS